MLNWFVSAPCTQGYVACFVTSSISVDGSGQDIIKLILPFLWEVLAGVTLITLFFGPLLGWLCCALCFISL